MIRLQIKITEEQKEWLIKEAKRTGNSLTTLIRELIQEKLDANELP